MKVIKEALLGKVSRLFKHGAVAIRRFNTKSYLQGWERQEEWERQTQPACCSQGKAPRAANSQQTRAGSAPLQPCSPLGLTSSALCHRGAGSATLCHTKLFSPAWKLPGGAQRARQLFCHDTTEVWLLAVINLISTPTHLDS